ncbi:MAG: ABC transporter ATP-binding protein, partial [Clostridia bacterium]
MSITKRSRSDNVIPDYEYLFSEDGTVSSDKKKKNNLIAKVFRPYLPVILFSLVLYVIKASPVWIMPIITANIINIASAGVFSETVTQQLILNSAILAIALLQNVPMHVWYSKLTDKILRNTGAGIRAVVIRKLQHLSITYHKQIETGEIQSKFLRDIESVENLLTNILKFIVPNIIGVLISTGIALYTNRIVTLFFVVVIPLNIVLTRAFSGKLKRGNREYRVAHESMSVRLSNMLEMLTVTKAHGLEEEEIHRFEDSIKSLTTKGLAVDKTNAYFGSWAWVIGNLLSGSCLIFCAVLALNGKIKAGDIVLYQSLFGSINGSIQNLINNVPQISVGREAVSSLEEILRSHE